MVSLKRGGGSGKISNLLHFVYFWYWSKSLFKSCHNQLTSIRNLNAFNHVLCNEILHEILKKSNKLHPQNIHEVPVMNFCVATTIPNTKGISFNYQTLMCRQCETNIYCFIMTAACDVTRLALFSFLRHNYWFSTWVLSIELNKIRTSLFIAFSYVLFN